MSAFKCEASAECPSAWILPVIAAAAYTPVRSATSMSDAAAIPSVR